MTRFVTININDILRRAIREQKDSKTVFDRHKKLFEKESDALSDFSEMELGADLLRLTIPAAAAAAAAHHCELEADEDRALLLKMENEIKEEENQRLLSACNDDETKRLLDEARVDLTVLKQGKKS